MKENVSLSDFLKRMASSPGRNLRKNVVLKRIEANEQRNWGTVNVHRMDSRNVGDFYCAPHHYFPDIVNKSLDIFNYKRYEKEVTSNFIQQVSENKLIIGGGGLLNRGSFTKQMKLFAKLSQGNKKTVLWGLGHNSGNPSDFGKSISYNIDLRTFGLVGTRDYESFSEWVPCVSCMHELFDNHYEVIQETGIIFHKKTMKRQSLLSRYKSYPTTSNTTDLASLLRFIGSSESIITDSYHAMYWSMLLGKKVAVVPNSSKFFDFKYQPVITDFDNCLSDIKKASIYSGVLEECRDKNVNFASKVAEYLNN